MPQVRFYLREPNLRGCSEIWTEIFPGNLRQPIYLRSIHLTLWVKIGELHGTSTEPRRIPDPAVWVDPEGKVKKLYNILFHSWIPVTVITDVQENKLQLLMTLPRSLGNTLLVTPLKKTAPIPPAPSSHSY